MQFCCFLRMCIEIRLMFSDDLAEIAQITIYIFSNNIDGDCNNYRDGVRSKMNRVMSNSSFSNEHSARTMCALSNAETKT